MIRDVMAQGFMIGFTAVLLVLIFVTLIVQLITKMKIVGANELAIVAGKGSEGFATLRGGRVFIWPLIHRFYKMDLRPRTTSVPVESAIATGIVPLTVVATVSFAVASSGKGLRNAIRRILLMTQNWEELTHTATSIIEGHLRDSIATMTPEQVMTDKDILVQNMIRVCKADLEGIGLEITAMNIADVDDHRLDGVPDPELYIALLKRIQAANAETQAREARALAQAAAKEASEARRAEVAIRAFENARENLLAETRVKVATERQRAAVEVQKAMRDAEAQVAGIRAQIEAEQQRIEMLRAKYAAEVLIPAEAEKARLMLEAQTQAAALRGRAQAEIDQLKRTVEILQQGARRRYKPTSSTTSRSSSSPWHRRLTFSLSSRRRLSPEQVPPILPSRPSIPIRLRRRKRGCSSKHLGGLPTSTRKKSQPINKAWAVVNHVGPHGQAGSCRRRARRRDRSPLGTCETRAARSTLHHQK